MKNNKRKAAGDAAAAKGKDRLFRLIIALLAVILVIMAIITIARINASYSDYVSTPNELLRSIKNRYYADAVREMHDNIALGETADKDEDYAVPYALLDYFEAESVYTGYVKAAEKETDPAKAAELMERAGEFKAGMEAAKAGMGDLAFMAEDIDGYFG